MQNKHHGSSCTSTINCLIFPIPSYLLSPHPQVKAEDADDGVNGTVTYHFHISTLPDVMEAFDLNSDTGDLSLKKNVQELGRCFRAWPNLTWPPRT